jgi:hypothetical protein
LYYSDRNLHNIDLIVGRISSRNVPVTSRDVKGERDLHVNQRTKI